jgi:hypothetical protein
MPTEAGEYKPAHDMREGEVRYQANELAKTDRRLADLLLRLRVEGTSWVETLKEMRRRRALLPAPHEASS